MKLDSFASYGNNYLICDIDLLVILELALRLLGILLLSALILLNTGLSFVNVTQAESIVFYNYYYSSYFFYISNSFAVIILLFSALLFYMPSLD